MVNSFPTSGYHVYIDIILSSGRSRHAQRFGHACLCVAAWCHVSKWLSLFLTVCQMLLLSLKPRSRLKALCSQNAQERKLSPVTVSGEPVNELSWNITAKYRECYFPSTWTHRWLFSVHGLGLLATPKAAYSLYRWNSQLQSSFIVANSSHTGIITPSPDVQSSFCRNFCHICLPSCFWHAGLDILPYIRFGLRIGTENSVISNLFSVRGTENNTNRKIP